MRRGSGRALRNRARCRGPGLLGFEDAVGRSVSRRIELRPGAWGEE